MERNAKRLRKVMGDLHDTLDACGSVSALSFRRVCHHGGVTGTRLCRRCKARTHCLMCAPLVHRLSGRAYRQSERDSTSCGGSKEARATQPVRECARCVAGSCSAFAHTPAQAARPDRIASGALWCGARRGGRAAAPSRSHPAKPSTRPRARRAVMVARSDAPGDAAQGGGAAAHGPHITHG